jgi:hypothetical protein
LSLIEAEMENAAMATACSALRQWARKSACPMLPASLFELYAKQSGLTSFLRGLPWLQILPGGACLTAAMTLSNRSRWLLFGF